MSTRFAAMRLPPRPFGRRRPVADAPAAPRPAAGLAEDAALFATSFAAGFLFVAIFLG